MLDPSAVRDGYADDAPVELGGWFLQVVGLLFAALWLSEIVPAALAGEPLQSAEAAGLITNPVEMLDLAIALPAMLLAGSLLLRHRPLGYVLSARCSPSGR